MYFFNNSAGAIGKGLTYPFTPADPRSRLDKRLGHCVLRKATPPALSVKCPPRTSARMSQWRPPPWSKESFIASEWSGAKRARDLFVSNL